MKNQALIKAYSLLNFFVSLVSKRLGIKEFNILDLNYFYAEVAKKTKQEQEKNEELKSVNNNNPTAVSSEESGKLVESSSLKSVKKVCSLKRFFLSKDSGNNKFRIFFKF